MKTHMTCSTIVSTRMSASVSSPICSVPTKKEGIEKGRYLIYRYWKEEREKEMNGKRGWECRSSAGHDNEV